MKKKLVALLLSGAMVTGLFTCTVVVNAETNTAAEEEEAEESGSVLDEIFSEDGLIGRLTDGKAGVILKSAASHALYFLILSSSFAVKVLIHKSL